MLERHLSYFAAMWTKTSTSKQLNHCVIHYRNNVRCKKVSHLKAFPQHKVEWWKTDLLCDLTHAVSSEETCRLHRDVKQHKWTDDDVDNARAKLLQIACTYSVHSRHPPVSDNYNQKSHKYVCITTYQPDTKSNTNPNLNPNPYTKQHEIVNIQLNAVACPTYPDKFIRDMMLHRLRDFRL